MVAVGSRSGPPRPSCSDTTKEAHDHDGRARWSQIFIPKALPSQAIDKVLLPETGYILVLENFSIGSRYVGDSRSLSSAFSGKRRL